MAIETYNPATGEAFFDFGYEIDSYIIKETEAEFYDNRPSQEGSGRCCPGPDPGPGRE